jgi:uncharacterized membrane protein HdeD (DUF308 family)
MPAPATRSPWLTIEAIALIVLGLAALFAPILAGVAVALCLGVILTAAGLIGLVSAFAGRGHAHPGWSVISAILALVVGLFLLFIPLAGAVVLSLVIGAYLILDGVTLIGLALDHRKRGDRRWGWLLAAGIGDIILALIILTLSAFGAAALIGVIVGIDLILAGVALLALHRGPRILPV